MKTHGVISVADLIELHRRNWPEVHDPQRLRFVLALVRAHNSVLSQAAATFEHHGLTTAEYDALATLRRSGAPWKLTPSQIQRSMLITSGGLTKILRQLESRHLVSRPRSGHDRRSKPVRLSARGRATVDRAAEELAAVIGARIQAVLEDPELAQLTALLERLASAG